MRRDGYLMEEIAREVGCSATTVHEDITYCLNLTLESLSESADQARQLEIERLDRAED